MSHEEALQSVLHRLVRIQTGFRTACKRSKHRRNIFWCCRVSCAGTPQGHLQYIRWNPCLDGTQKTFIVAATVGDNALGGIHFDKGLMILVLNKINWANPDVSLTTKNCDLALVTLVYVLLLCWPM